MPSYAVVDAAGNIVNRIEMQDGATWTPPEGCSMQPDAGYEIGGTIVGGAYTAPVQATDPIPSPPPSILSQNLMAQFNTDDATKIQAAIAGNVQFWLLWSAMQAQSDPMLLTNPRFLQGWTALTQVLGATRMAAIAASLNVTVG